MLELPGDASKLPPPPPAPTPTRLRERRWRRTAATAADVDRLQACEVVRKRKRTRGEKTSMPLLFSEGKRWEKPLHPGVKVAVGVNDKLVQTE